MRGFSLSCFIFGCATLLVGHTHASALQKFESCQLIATDWADGDSFSVRFPNESIYTIRLYGADTIETVVNNSTLARRLRAQRRYFGISGYGSSPQVSIKLAKQLGHDAKAAVQELLKEPFTVYTAFADGRGSSRHQRIYGFIETANGDDLATKLVELGLARAFGVYRSTPDGSHRDEYIETLKDAEFVAARRGLGAWKYTDWNTLPSERRAQRIEDQEDALAMGQSMQTGPVNINRADLNELKRLPGVGDVMAQRIIEARPFKQAEDLRKVSGIGPATYENISELIEL